MGERAGSTVLHSYAVATRIGPRPRHVLHVQMDGKAKAMCGAGPVRFVGEVDQVWDESWPYCEPCKDALDPDGDWWWDRGF